MRVLHHPSMARRSFLPTPVPLYLYATLIISQLFFLFGAVSVFLASSSLIARAIAIVLGLSALLMLILLELIHRSDVATTKK